MAYSMYSKDILKLIYHLTTNQKMMTPSEVEKHTKDKFLDVSSRTLLRWFKYLKEQEANDYSFDYYPYINFNAFGLISVIVIFSEPISEAVLKIIPHLQGSFVGRNNLFKKQYLASYLIPPEKLEDFELILKKIKSKKLVKEYFLLKADKVTNIYSPFHEIFDENGELNFNKSIDNTYFIENIKVKKREIKMLDFIKKEPFIIPIVFEQFRESFSSQRVWIEIYKHLKENAWKFIGNSKIKYKQNPDQAIKYIQTLNKKLQNRFNDIFDQVRVYYKPFFSQKNNLSAYIKLKLNSNNIEELRKLSDKISCHAIETIIYPSREFEKDCRVIIFVISSFIEIYEILKIAKNYQNFEYLIEDKKEIWKVWNRDFMKFKYWEVFDIEKKEWIFDTEKYLKNIEVLAKS